MLLEVALQMADDRKLDLVLISPNAKPPVAKIMDYGKYRYEQQKREKEAKKKQKIIQIKEIRLAPFIEKHDLEVKAHNAKKFLKEGDKVKVSLRFRGRARGRTERGFEVMEKFSLLVADSGVVEKKSSFEGASLIMILAPLPEKEKKRREAQEHADRDVLQSVGPEESPGNGSDDASAQAKTPVEEAAAELRNE